MVWAGTTLIVLFVIQIQWQREYRGCIYAYPRVTKKWPQKCQLLPTICARYGFSFEDCTLSALLHLCATYSYIKLTRHHPLESLLWILLLTFHIYWCKGFCGNNVMVRSQRHQRPQWNMIFKCSKPLDCQQLLIPLRMHCIVQFQHHTVFSQSIKGAIPEE